MKDKLKEFIIKNNKILLLVVGILLVLTISISFAYFTGRAEYFAKKIELVETTAVIDGEKVIVNGNLSFNDFDILPGHKNISELKVSSNEITSPVFFNLIWNGINNLNTSLNFYVYKTESEIDTGATCEKIKKNVDGTIRYYEECSIKNETLLGEAINTGTISKSDNEAKVNLLNDEYITPTENERYYYVVLEYPNLDESQNEDIGGNFSGKVTAEAGDPTKRLIYVNVLNGSSSPEKKIVTVGATESFNITPNEHYDIASSTVACTNNTSAILSSNTLTLSNITNHDTCTVTLIRNDYTININVTNGNGTTATTLSAGNSTSFTITPNSGYVIDGADVTGDNCNLSGNTLSINNISDNVNCNINIKNSRWSRYNVNSSTTYYWNKYSKKDTPTVSTIRETGGSGFVYVATTYAPLYKTNLKTEYSDIESMDEFICVGSDGNKGSCKNVYEVIDNGDMGYTLNFDLNRGEYFINHYHTTAYKYNYYERSGESRADEFKVYYSSKITLKKFYDYKGTYIERVSSSSSSTYPDNGLNGDFWYDSKTSSTNYSQGSYIDSIVALYGTYPTNNKSGSYWYVRN